MPITIDGSGTVTGISAGGLPDGVITTNDIADSAVTTGKIAGAPAFRAYPSGSTNLSNSVITKVPLNTETFDTANCFDSTTNYRFTPNVSGYYQLSACTYLAQQGTTWGGAFLIIYKNGVAHTYGAGLPINTNTVIVNVSDVVFFNGTSDYVELYVSAYGTGTLPLLGGTGATFFSAALIRPA